MKALFRIFLQKVGDSCCPDKHTSGMSLINPCIFLTRRIETWLEGYPDIIGNAISWDASLPKGILTWVLMDSGNVWAELSAIRAITCILVPGQTRAFDRCQTYALGHRLSNSCLQYRGPLNLGRILDRLSKGTSESYYWVYTFTGLFGVRRQDATTSMPIILTLAKVPLPRGWRVTWHKIELNINSFTKTRTLDSILERGKTTEKQWSWKREIEGLSLIGLWKEIIWPTQPHIPDGILNTDYQDRH